MFAELALARGPFLVLLRQISRKVTDWEGGRSSGGFQALEDERKGIVAMEAGRPIFEYWHGGQSRLSG